MIPQRACGSWTDGDRAEISADERASPVAAALYLLRGAAQSADDLGHDRWEFAVEIWALFEAGLSLNDLRRLVCQGLVQHQCETTRRGAAHRSFAAPRGLRLAKQSCFVLAEDADAGDFAPQVAAWHDPEDAGSADRHTLRLRVSPTTGGKPHWNRERRELVLDGQVVKALRRPAPNQELILQAFEEEGWPERIADPLPVLPGMPAKRRLHETIQSLNAGHDDRVLVFQGDGTGEGILWHRAAAPQRRIPVATDAPPTLRLRRAA
jgi:hypothetical protein